MKDLALDLWNDLRAKRLWPVAAALLLALIAVPILVIKPAEEPAPTAADPPASQAQPTPAVGAAESGSRESSRLDVFGRKDPFRPPAAPLEPSTSGATAASGGPAGASAPPPTSGGSPPASGSPSPPLGGSGGSGAAGGTSAPSPPPVASPRRRLYTYVIDLRFGREGKTRLRRGIPRLTALPSERSPVAIFLGVSASGKRAVFLLNPAFEQRGQGTCRPRRATCNFLHLSTDPDKNGHRIVDGKGVNYLLRLEAIRRVPVRRASRASRRSPSGRAGATSADVHSPVLADEHR